MKLFYRKQTYSFRSRGLFQFLKILQDACPDWVDLAGIEARLPDINPRQLARFIDLLEAAGLPLVDYETKTRGRFRLAVKPDAISFSGDKGLPVASTAAPAEPLTPMTTLPLAVYQDEAWISWVIALLHSNLALHDGRMSGNEGALDHLDSAEAATASLPLWTVSVVHIRRAFVLVRESRFREASFWLRRVDTSIRDGHAHPSAQVRVQLIRAKMRYDQARYDEAEQLLVLPTDLGRSHCPHRINLLALISGRKFLAANEAEAPILLSQTLAMLTEAFGQVFLWHGDSSLLDGLCYNFANNLLRGIRRGLIPETCADTVMKWLAANILVCRKMGIGEDSVLAALLLIDVGLDYGYSITKWPHLLRNELDISGDLEGLLTKSLAQARQMGNTLEIAQCLKRKMRLATTPDMATGSYSEASELLRKQGRKDLLHGLAEEWQRLFSTPPPKPVKKTGTE